MLNSTKRHRFSESKTGTMGRVVTKLVNTNVTKRSVQVSQNWSVQILLVHPSLIPLSYLLNCCTKCEYKSRYNDLKHSILFPIFVYLINIIFDVAMNISRK